MMNKNSGAVLLITVFIIFLAALLVIGFLELATTEFEISRNHKSECIATYIADAGVEAAIEDLLNGGDGNIAKTKFPDTVDDNSYYTVTQTARLGTTYTVESLGEYGTFQKTMQGRIRVTGNTAVLQYWKEI